MSASLPKPLLPWEEELRHFPPDLAASLGPFLERISLAVGPLRAQVRDGRDEPDGYHGLSRRGPYERLLASEWLLADEAPDEFLRRAAMKEHAFFELSFKQPSGGRRSVALFDAGPSQLGAPRLGQLAALLVLARRARLAGVAFAWGVLQRPADGLTDELSPWTLLKLIAGRTAIDPGEDAVAAWSGALGELSARDDLWLCGGAKLAGLGFPPFTTRLRFADVAEPGIRALLVTLSREGGAPKTEFSLPLPAANLCARLVRDPFELAKPPPRRIDSSQPSDLLFATSERWLFLRTGHAEVQATGYSIDSGSQPRNRRYQVALGGRIVAADWQGTRALLGVLEKDGTIRVAGLSKNACLNSPQMPAFKATPEDPFVAPDDGTLSPLLLVHRRDGERELLLVDGNGTLFRCVKETGSLRVLHRNVTGARLRQGRVLLALGGEVRKLAALAPDGGISTFAHAFDGDGSMRAVFGFGGLIAHSEFGLMAVERRRNAWTIISGRVPVEVAVQEDDRVVGVAANAVGHAGLVVLPAGRRSLLWRMEGGAGETTLLTTTSPITAVTGSHASSTLAFVEEGGGLHVFNIQSGRRARIGTVAAPGPGTGAPGR